MFNAFKMGKAQAKVGKQYNNPFQKNDRDYFRFEIGYKAGLI